MKLTPMETDRLMIFLAAELARRRRGRSLLLTYPEAVALICDEMHEAARSGATYGQVVETGRSVLSAHDVAEGVAALVGTIRVECLFADGTRLVTVVDPIRRESSVTAGPGHDSR